jgi:hypothetical protein
VLKELRDFPATDQAIRAVSSVRHQ